MSFNYTFCSFFLKMLSRFLFPDKTNLMLLILSIYLQTISPVIIEKPLEKSIDNFSIKV
jgi:hypothetical protein